VLVQPRIAITCWRRELPTFLGERTRLYTLGDEYVAQVVAAGAVPLVVPHLPDGAVDAVLDVVDGLVIAGGGDVDPASYGQPDAASKDTDASADATEIALARRARERGMPTLAICRGMQIVNVGHGGTLVQDIVAEGTPHPPISEDPEHVVAFRHPVTIDEGSLLGDVLGAGRRVVNAIHHQAVDVVADGFHVTARADDGVIEAIEADDGWDLLAVQWHPEKLGEDDRALFVWLAEAAGRGGGRN
jgi:putative glutamine amidotransferase